MDDVKYLMMQYTYKGCSTLLFFNGLFHVALRFHVAIFFNVATFLHATTFQWTFHVVYFLNVATFS